jgi:hypothetical protein
MLDRLVKPGHQLDVHCSTAGNRFQYLAVTGAYAEVICQCLRNLPAGCAAT